MNMLCFFHKWKEEDRRVNSWYTGEKSQPTSNGMETKFLLRCERCGERKVQNLKGMWDKKDAPNGSV